MDYQIKIELEFGTLALRNDGIVEFTQKPFLIGVDEVKICHQEIDKLPIAQPFLLLTIAPLGSSATKEAREYAAMETIRNRMKAQAIVVDSLATRILAGFYMKVNKPSISMKIFNNKESAIDWLRKQD